MNTRILSSIFGAALLGAATGTAAQAAPQAPTVPGDPATTAPPAQSPAAPPAQPLLESPTDPARDPLAELLEPEAAAPAYEVTPPQRAPEPARAHAEAAGTPTSRATATVVLGGRHAQRRDGGGGSTADAEENDDERTLHGFRLGYALQLNYDKPRVEGQPETSPKEEYELESPHHFVIGYELARRMRSDSEWLNVLLVGNFMVAGLEQSRFLPTTNFLIGFELERSLQLGVGINLALTQVKPAHMILAAGWTPKSGSLYLPVHFFFVPDVDRHYRAGITVGVNWGA